MDEQEDANEPMEVNSDSDSSSSDDEQEQILLARAEELERQISDNKYLYNAHEELVTLYQRLGDLKSMRLAYERFHEYFPLTPEIWLAWINDEKKLANSESEIKHVFALFDKAVEDYLSVPLWLEYAQYSIGAASPAAARALLERALTAAGLHCADGALLWDALRELELAQTTPTATAISDIFRRQLSVPLLGMAATHAEFTEWLHQLPSDHGLDTRPIEWAYTKALETLKLYEPFEARLRLAEDDAHLLQTYTEYIKAITDPSTILCVFERAVAKLCLNSALWLDYCNYTLKLGELGDKVSARAVRNCPWSEELWVARLRILEKLQRGEGEVMQCFELGMATMVGEQGGDLWLAYLEYSTRTPTADEAKVRKLFEQALGQLPSAGEGYAKVARWLARRLAKQGEMQRARRVWKGLLQQARNKGAASLWLEFANLERQFGDKGQARAVFQRALANCTDWPQFLAEEWLMFEREEGKLEDVIKCIDKKNELLKQLETRKRKRSEEATEEVKKVKVETPAPKKVPVVKDPTKTVFISNLYPSVNEKKLKKVFPNSVNIELVTDRQGKSRCYGYVQFTLEEEVLHALARDREPIDGRPIFISNCKPNRSERNATFKYSFGVEENKLFVKGLPLDKGKEDVEGIFKPFGVKEVRLVLKKSGQPKGLAYVEFNDRESAKRAMEQTDGMKVGEHTISVAVSAPPPKAAIQKGAASGPARHARSRLQVAMVPRSVQVKKDKEEENGEVKGAKAKSNEDFRKMLLK